MKTLKTLTIAGACLLALAAQSVNAQAYPEHDVTPNVIFGENNGNGSWTISRDPVSKVELGIRAKVRGEGIYNYDGDRTYTHDKADPSFDYIPWNIEFSVNSNFTGGGGLDLGDIGVFGYMDKDPTADVQYTRAVSFHLDTGMALGTNATEQSGGVVWRSLFQEGDTLQDKLAYLQAYNVAQDSLNLGVYKHVGEENKDLLPFFDPTSDGTWDFKLVAFDSPLCDPNSVECSILAETEIRVVVGDGIPAVPVPAAAWLFGSGLLGLAFGARRRRKV